MTCPRCGNEWDVSQSPCPSCGLLVHLPERLRRARAGGASPKGASLPAGPQLTNQQRNPVQGQESFSSSSMPLPAMPASPPATPRPQVSFNGSEGRDGNARVSQPLSSTPMQRTNPYQAVPMGPRPVRMQPNAPKAIERMPSTSEATDRARANFGQSLPPLPPLSTRSGEMEVVEPQRTPFSSSVTPRVSQVVDPLVGSAQPAVRPHRLVTNTANPAQSTEKSVERETRGGQVASMDEQGVLAHMGLLMPGTLLRGGRYRLQELQERQEWLASAYESTWTAQDAQRAGVQVIIRELMVPNSASMMMQSMLRTATMTLTSVGRHARIPTLWDAFSDQGRNFFVFEPANGESLLAQMRRTGYALPEQDVIECCLQIVEVLDLLSRQSPPLVHGLITPEHIISTQRDSQYMLTNFSIILAGGAMQFITGIDRMRLSPYTAPEFARGAIDTRSDMYSLLATAYHAVTGSLPSETNGSIPLARQLNPRVSPQFEAILSRGLQPISSQRYQHPAELRQELLALRSGPWSFPAKEEPAGKISSQERLPAQALQTIQAEPQDSVAQILPNILAPAVDALGEREGKLLLPRPEELPPIPQRNDMRDALIWLGAILVCLIVIVLLSRGLA